LCEIYNKMRNILLFGAGRSASSLINYILQHAQKEQLHLTIADLSLTAAQEKTKGHPHATAVELNSSHVLERQKLIEKASIVISMLPAHLHIEVAMDSIQLNKHLVTASYISPAMQALDEQVKEKGLIFMNEIGLDPGIDHMSAMDMIHRIQAKGGQITGFYSHCGGLVAPESDNNPWHYKISWNPRNVVLAGQAGAVYLKDGRQVEVPYTQMFSNTGGIQLKDGSKWGFYPNRDSLSYISLYGLETASTFIRTTLRHPSFLEGWNALVTMGLTKDEPIKDFPVSYSEFFEQPSVSQFSEHVQSMLHWLGMDHKLVFKKNGKTYADLLQEIIEEKWKLDPSDKDMIIMQHQIQYALDGQQHEQVAELVVKGKDAQHTAMSMTVGLPLGIAAKCILDGKWNFFGLHIPIHASIYEPVLNQLEHYGIRFEEYSK